MRVLIYPVDGEPTGYHVEGRARCAGCRMSEEHVMIAKGQVIKPMFREIQGRYICMRCEYRHFVHHGRLLDDLATKKANKKSASAETMGPWTGGTHWP